MSRPRSIAHGCALLAATLGIALAVDSPGALQGEDKATQSSGKAPSKVAAPAYGAFPTEPGVAWMGELINVDPVNRRGVIRPGGVVTPDRYNRFPGQPFALLPYGMVSYHGAAAELRDVPLGTVLHGEFYLPPPGDHSVPRPTSKAKGDAQRNAYFVEQTHALRLEDDVSYYRRHGQAWRIDGFETSDKDGRRFLLVTSVGNKAPAGLSGPQKFCIDKSTRVWKGKEFASLEDAQPGQTVQVNLTWDPGWGYASFHVLDLWLDERAIDVAAEVQRQTHLRYQRYHWLPGWVDKVTYHADQPNGSATVSVTLFGGLDASLYDEVGRSRTAQIAIAEPTLRTWRKDQDAQGGRVEEVLKLPNPPAGSGPVQIRVHVRQALEGFRAGGIVRVGLADFPAGVLPPEERINGLEDRDRAPAGGSVAPTEN